jgi:hypothetical protein
MATKVKQLTEAKAKATGFKDAVLVVLATGAAYVLTLAGEQLVPFLSTAWDGKYAWTQPIVALLIGAVIKGLDRKKHEDPSPSTGLLKI